MMTYSMDKQVYDEEQKIGPQDAELFKMKKYCVIYVGLMIAGIH